MSTPTLPPRPQLPRRPGVDGGGKPPVKVYYRRRRKKPRVEDLPPSPALPEREEEAGPSWRKSSLEYDLLALRGDGDADGEELGWLRGRPKHGGGAGKTVSFSEPERRRPARPTASVGRRWVELEIEGADPNTFVGLACMVFWLLNDEWYKGSITAYNEATKKHYVKYDNGDSEELRLADERIKFSISSEEMKFLNLKFGLSNQDKKSNDELLSLGGARETVFLSESERWHPDRPKGSVERWVELDIKGVDPNAFVGLACKVFWSGDFWYKGSIMAYNEATKKHFVIYDDGDLAELHLVDERIKFPISFEGMKSQNPKFGINNQNKMRYDELLSLGGARKTVFFSEPERRPPDRPKGSVKRRWVELDIKGMDPNVLVGLACKVFWSGDNYWYKGSITTYNEATKKHFVKYDNGDSEELRLADERIKISISLEELMSRNLKFSNQDKRSYDELLSLGGVGKTFFFSESERQHPDRPKGHVERWVEPDIKGVDPNAFVGLACKVFWSGDDFWYKGSIMAYNEATEKHSVMYDDGDLEELRLADERIKYPISFEQMKSQNPKFGISNQNKMNYDELLSLGAGKTVFFSEPERRTPDRPKGSVKRRWVELDIKGVDPNVLVGLACKVFWSGDNYWYKGSITTYNEATMKHFVKYDNGDSEGLRLADERIKFSISLEELKSRNQKFSNQDKRSYDELLSLGGAGKTVFFSKSERRHADRPKGSVERWVEPDIKGVDPNAFVGLVCKVFWSGDDFWYKGSIMAYNEATKRHFVIYDDGDLEELRLVDERIKFPISFEGMKSQNPKFGVKIK